MADALSRRDVLKAGAALTVAPALSRAAALPRQAAPILPLTSTSDVFVPPRGGGFQKFSFDNPEPSVAFAGLRFGFLVFSRENVYTLDPEQLRAEATDDALTITASGLRWTGGQERANGRLVARIRKAGEYLEWDATVELDQPIKAVSAIVRDVPRGRLSLGGGEVFDPRDNEILVGYPFGAGDLFGGNTARSMSTTLAVVRVSESEHFFLSSLDDKVRAKRFYFQPGEHGYRVEAVFEAEGWLNQRRLTVPPWRVGRTPTLEAAIQLHYDHIERAFRLPRFETRADVPDWLRRTALVVTLHGMHYTGFVFNDYARMLEILRSIGERLPAERVLAFISAWDGRYYWDYPDYRAADRLGGEAGFRRLVREGQRLGFHIMPMFGANAANRRLPSFERLADAATERVDGDRFDINWVDWDNDRHQEGWLSYMNLGVPSWRRHLTSRIADCLDRYGADAYFLDISAGWMNNTSADMHEGMKQMVAELRARYPRVLACGEFHYDALLEFLPLYHVYTPRAVPWARFFSHLSHPAPGRGSSGVHESGFGRFDPETLSLTRRDGLIPTLNVVDDTFTTYRAQAEAVIDRAKEWAS